MARQTNAAYWAQRMKNMEDALLAADGPLVSALCHQQ